MPFVTYAPAVPALDDDGNPIESRLDLIKSETIRQQKRQVAAEAARNAAKARSVARHAAAKVSP